MRTSIGTPMTSTATKILLLGGGELGKEVAIEAHKLGIEVVVADRYDWAPAMHVAHRRYVIDLLDEKTVKDVVRREKPDAVIPEIEAVSIDALRGLEDEGYNIVPNAKAVEITMNRIKLRRFAAEELGLPTTRYMFAENEEEAIDACEKIGYPCLIKPEMSSSGHGHVKILDSSPKSVREAYRYAIQHARGASKRVIAEEYVELETEFTILAYRCSTSNGLETKTLEPIEHYRYGEFHYIESWQPSTQDKDLLSRARSIGLRVAERLGGLGIYGVELFLSRDGRLLFSEVAPRPHDTGMVTLVTQSLSEFAIHLRCSLGLPVTEPVLLSPGASLAVYAGKGGGLRAPVFHGIDKTLALDGVDVRVFGKPYAYPGRRMLVVLARGENVEEARRRARLASSYISILDGV